MKETAGRSEFLKAMTTTLSPSDIWNAVKKRLQAMSPQEKEDTLKQAGILTETGEVALPYKAVFVDLRD